VDDLPLDGGLVACFARSSLAHARLTDLDLEARGASPGWSARSASSDLSRCRRGWPSR